MDIYARIYALNYMAWFISSQHHCPAQSIFMTGIWLDTVTVTVPVILLEFLQPWYHLFTLCDNSRLTLSSRYWSCLHGSSPSTATSPQFVAFRHCRPQHWPRVVRLQPGRSSNCTVDTYNSQAIIIILVLILQTFLTTLLHVWIYEYKQIE